MSRALTSFVGWAASIFQEIEGRGGPLPDGPLLVTANHQNALLDPLAIFRVAGRPTRPLAKAPLFDQVMMGAILRSIGGLPVYRPRDDPTQVHRNQDTFRAAIAALLAGDALQIYPEGRSHSNPALAPLRTGAARIALAAEAEAGGELGLRIVPVGLTWEQKHRFRGRVLVEIGEPFPVRPWLTDAGAEDHEAVRSLTDEIARRLEDVTLNLPSEEDRELVEIADRFYSRKKGIHGYRERDRLADRVPRLRRLAGALERLREEDPERHRDLAARIRRHDRFARLAGVREGDVPSRYRPAAVARYVAKEGAALLVELPLAAAGTVLWYPTWFVPPWIVRRVGPEYEAIATTKLAVALALAPVTVLAAVVVGYLAGGIVGAVVAAVVVPALGLVALRWRGRWKRVREDAALFLRVLRRPRFRRGLARGRAELAAELDEILAREERRE